MDPNKKPSFPGLPGATRFPWQQQLGRGLPTEEPGPVGRARGLPFLTEGAGIGRARSFPPPGDSLPMQIGRGGPLPVNTLPVQIGRGAPLPIGDLPVQIGRGAPIPAGALPVQFGRGSPLLNNALPMQIGRGAGPLPTDSLPVQIGRGTPLLPTNALPVQIGRGAPLAADAVPVQIGRGAPLPTGSPVQIGRGGPLATEPPVGFARGIPAGIKTSSGDVPTHGRGSALVAMFRGMGIEPLQTSWGRGGPPVGRGEAPGYLGAEVKEQAAPVGVLSGPGQPEEVMGRGASFLGRGIMPGVGRAAMPQLGVGRGPTQVLSPGPIMSKAPSSDVPPPPIPQPSVYTDAPEDSCSVTLSEDSSTPDDLGQVMTKTELKMEATREPLNKIGTKGTVVTVGSNQIPICCKNEAVYQYHVTFKPNVESIGMRFGMLRDHRPTTGEVVAFDGSILYLPVKMEKVVFLKSERRTDNQEITIKIEMTKILPPHSDLCIPFYNVVLRRLMKIVGLKLVGRNHYDPQSAVILGKHRLQIWPGYSTSIKHTDGGLYLSVDVSHKVLRNDSVLNVMTAFYQQSTQSFQDDCTKELLGAIVITRYNNRTYRIDDIKWDKSPKDTFTMADGSETSFVEYYSKNYGITIKEMDQPMLVHRPKERSKPGGKQILTGEILLVPELAFMTGIPDKMRQDFRAMKDLTIHINVSADQHTQSIKQLLKNINSNPEALTELARWGLGIGTEILMTQGRTLPMETICLQTASFVTGPDVSWSREVTRESVISCVPLNLWAIFYPRRAAEQAEELVSTFLKVGKPMGIQLQKPVRVELRDDRTETYVKTIHSHLTSEPNVQLVVAIITGNRDDLYSAIKKLCCIQRPVPSQCINVRTISQPQKLRSVAQKILLQMNCKLGGALWTVNVPLKQLMVIGVDVNHDTSKKKQSVMGFVASLNSLMTQWYSRVIFQTATEEIISGFRLCFLAALQKYYEINHSLPEKIVVFRDGVGDGQLNAVEHYEIPQLLKCFETFPNYEPKLTFLVVQKRISTTLYSISGNHYGSPPPGTVLDHTVTHRDWVDFFLMAHTIRQGCGLPTHYICVYNTANLAPDHLQRLTFKMCHLYWNWPGTVRVPAPCRYAHKLAFLAGQHLHAEPSIQLADKLYFL